MAEGDCNNTLGSIWPDDIYVICGSGEAIEPGDASSTFTSMIGWKIRIIRGGTPLWSGNPGDGSMYYDYTSITGEVTWSAVPADTEQFIIQAYKPAS